LWSGVTRDIVRIAERLAERVLFPTALAIDRADTLPVEPLDALSDAGLYGLTGPAGAGGLDADLTTVCATIEALASGCLTTTFVWAQHLGVVIAAAASDNGAIREWVGPLCRGDRRAGLALGGLLPGPTQLVARATDGGWRFTGTSPFVSGWGRVDVIHTAARTADGRLVWALLDAQESETLSVERLELAALNATATVRADFRGHAVGAQRVTSVVPHRAGPTPAELLRIHASFALGVARRSCLLLGNSHLDEELADVRATLDRLDQTTIEDARASAGELALRAAGALAVATGSRALLLSNHTQRLAREALFCVVYALPAGSRKELLAQLGATSPKLANRKSPRKTPRHRFRFVLQPPYTQIVPQVWLSQLR
jgi:alkylation response protein AidB-like acyl-CoA dehydrogenase